MTSRLRRYRKTSLAAAKLRKQRRRRYQKTVPVAGRLAQVFY
ncbi:MAG: hypothetical protein ACI4W2_12170 [Eubacterium sp.]